MEVSTGKEVMAKTKEPKSWKLDKDNRIIECIAEGCNEKPFAEGLCIKHYDKKREERM